MMPANPRSAQGVNLYFPNTNWHSAFSFIFVDCIHKFSGTHPAARLIGILDLAPRILWPQREADCSLLCSVESYERLELYLHSAVLLHGAVLN